MWFLPSSHRPLIGLVLLFALLSGGCHYGKPKPHPGPGPEPAPRPEPVPPPEPETLCVDWRWIAIQEDPRASCPDLTSVVPDFVGSLQGGPLFAAGPTGSPGGSTSAPPASCDPTAPFLPLSCFCVYAFEDRGIDLAALLEEPESHGLLALGRDCLAVVPAAGPDLVQVRREALERRFLGEAGGVVASLPAAAGRRVRLAVVDTAPTNARNPQDDDFNSPHGYLLVHMARRLLCPGGEDCAVDVTSRLTLRYLTLHSGLPGGAVTDEERGGFVGLIGDLARDLRDEVAAWEGAGQAHLILNLSLGWNGARFNSLAPTAVSAVRSALGDAACRGVLTVAAAGNQDWGPDPAREPLYPAWWEQQAAPTVAQCAALFQQTSGTLAAGYGDGSYRPLLFAAGAVRADGSPLPLARLGSEPRLVAFGDHGLVGTRRDSESVVPLTGTSVATLGISATVASLAAMGPETEGPFTLMEALHAAGEPLPRQADFVAPGGGPPGVRRVRLCAVRNRLSDQRGEGEVACAPRAPLPPVSPEQRDAVFHRAREIDLADYGPAGPPLRRCSPGLAAPFFGPERRRNFSGRGPGQGPGQEPGPFPCPHWQFPALWAHLGSSPQPGSTYCSTCEWDQNSPGKAYIEIDTLPRASARLSHPTLKVGNTVYPLDVDLNRRGPIRLLLRNIPIEEGEPVFLSVVVDGRFSSTSLLLGPPEVGGGD